MRVIWTPEAAQDRADVWDYIAVDNPLAVVHMDELFGDAAAGLALHPMLGKAGQISDPELRIATRTKYGLAITWL